VVVVAVVVVVVVVLGVKCDGGGGCCLGLAFSLAFRELCITTTIPVGQHVMPELSASTRFRVFPSSSRSCVGSTKKGGKQEVNGKDRRGDAQVDKRAEDGWKKKVCGVRRLPQQQ
jgi:hypothetical protein